MSTLNVTVNGTSIQQFAYLGDFEVTHRLYGGPWELKWNMDLPINFRHPALVRGAITRLWSGSTPLWAGELTEPNFDSQEFIASGLWRQGETALALDFGAITTNPAAAVGWAILRGRLAWNGLNTLPSVDFVDGETETHNYVADLLGAWAISEGVACQVDPFGFLSYAPLPTSPTYLVTPGAAILGVADDDYVTDLYATYAPKPGRVARVEAHDGSQGVGRVEKYIDLRGAGFMTSTRATAILNSLLARGRARTGWTNGLTVTYGQVFNLGHQPVEMSEIRGGQMVRLLGLYDERGRSAWTDIVLEETVWNVAEGTVELKPLGLADRDFASIVESVGGVLL